MGRKGIRNAKKITTDNILMAVNEWMNEMNLNMAIGTTVFNLRHVNGIISIYNEDGDLMRRFTATKPSEVTEGAITRHSWTKDLNCSRCGLDIYGVENANGECIIGAERVAPPGMEGHEDEFLKNVEALLKRKKRSKKKKVVIDNEDVLDFIEALKKI